MYQTNWKFSFINGYQHLDIVTAFGHFLYLINTCELLGQISAKWTIFIVYNYFKIGMKIVLKIVLPKGWTKGFRWHRIGRKQTAILQFLWSLVRRDKSLRCCRSVHPRRLRIPFVLFQRLGPIVLASHSVRGRLCPEKNGNVTLWRFWSIAHILNKIFSLYKLA